MQQQRGQRVWRLWSHEEHCLWPVLWTPVQHRAAAAAAAERQLREAAKAVDIELIDHVIIGRRESDPLGVGFFSFRNAGML